MRLVIQETFFYCASWVLIFLLFKASRGIGQILTYLHLGEGIVSVAQFCLIIMGYLVLGLWLYDAKKTIFER